MNCHRPSAFSIIEDVLVVAFGAACLLAVLISI